MDILTCVQSMHPTTVGNPAEKIHALYKHVFTALIECWNTWINHLFSQVIPLIWTLYENKSIKRPLTDLQPRKERQIKLKYCVYSIENEILHKLKILNVIFQLKTNIY